MGQEYKVSVFGKVFYGLCVAGMLIFLIVLMIAKSPQNKVIYLLPLTICVCCVLVLINLFKSRVLLTGNSICRERLFYKKILDFGEIKGIRIGTKVITAEPLDPTFDVLKITNYNDFANSEELTKWLREKFVDLNEVDRQKEEQALLNDNSLGYTIEERQLKISKMRQIAIAYNVWGFVMGMLLIFIRNISLSFWIGALYPLLGIAIMRLSSGLIKFVGASQKSLHMGIFLGLAMSVINVLIVALAGYEVLSFANVWPIVAAITIVVFILLYSTGVNKIEGVAKGQIVMMLLTSFMYGFGNTIVINCLFDRSTPNFFTTTVIDEYVSSGRGAQYHLKLNPWKTNGRVRKVDVSREDYEKAPIGSSISISEKKGLFNIPWFDFNFNPTPPVPAGSGSGNSPIPR